MLLGTLIQNRRGSAGGNKLELQGASAVISQPITVPLFSNFGAIFTEHFKHGTQLINTLTVAEAAVLCLVAPNDFVVFSMRIWVKAPFHIFQPGVAVQESI